LLTASRSRFFPPIIDRATRLAGMKAGQPARSNAARIASWDGAAALNYLTTTPPSMRTCCLASQAGSLGFVMAIFRVGIERHTSHAPTSFSESAGKMGHHFGKNAKKTQVFTG
jgi:hypothetical protein